jgi:hypothetical protein
MPSARNAATGEQTPGMTSADRLTDREGTAVAGATERDSHPAGHSGTALLVGFDGSPSAVDAIDIAARLLPRRSVRIAHIWAPPFGSPVLRSVWG